MKNYTRFRAAPAESFCIISAMPRADSKSESKPESDSIPAYVSPLSARDLARRIFAGEVLAFRSAARGVVRLAREVSRKAFAPEHPPRAHRVFARDEFLRRAQTAREMFESHPETPALFAESLAAAGMERDKIFLDLPRLRIAPPVATHSGGIVSHIGPHRDTWGVGIQAQMNWWGPVWALSKNRTMAFFPNHFRRALANTTATWSFAEYNAARKAATGGERPAYPAAPEPREAPDEAPVPVVIAPGDMLCFSAAHLHASVLNASNLTRFSLEIRSANPEDIRAGRGAPNADCETPRMALGLFRSPTGGGALSDFV